MKGDKKNKLLSKELLLRKEARKMKIPGKYKAIVKSCLDCHRTFGATGSYPCLIYRVCPCHVPGVFHLGRNGKGKNVRACLRVGTGCAC